MSISLPDKARLPGYWFSWIFVIFSGNLRTGWKVPWTEVLDQGLPIGLGMAVGRGVGYSWKILGGVDSKGSWELWKEDSCFLFFLFSLLETSWKNGVSKWMKMMCVANQNFPKAIFFLPHKKNVDKSVLSLSGTVSTRNHLAEPSLRIHKCSGPSGEDQRTRISFFGLI